MFNIYILKNILMKKLTTKDFIERSKKVHGDKYDYSKVEYININTKVCIICPVHGEFWQIPNSHLNGNGCKKCINKKLSHNKDIFIKKAKEIHGDKYDYSKVEYINNKTKVCIICPVHGEFWQTPNSHLNYQGCPKCVGKSKTTQDFINEAKKVHGDKYDYSKVEYINSQTKVCIICPVHGEFYMTPYSHINKQNCPKCSNHYHYSVNEWIERFKEVHGDKYDYSYLKENGFKKNKCKILCKIHNKYFTINKYNHLIGQGCPICGREKASKSITLTTKDFIERSKKVHGDKYDYSKVEYINYHTKVCIICPVHGEFWQKPTNHLSGCGCQICKESKLEKKMSFLLIKNNISFYYQKKFEWLGRQSLDFYLPDYNIAIECQGKQHFGIGGWGENYNFEEQKKLDEKKYNLCKNNNIKLIYFVDKVNYNISKNFFTEDNIFFDINGLYNIIFQY